MGGILFNTGMTEVILTALWQTLYMVFWSTLLSVIIGFIPAIILTLTAPDGLHPIPPAYELLSFLINVFRSFPFIILLVLVIPFTRLVVGKAIGTTASIVPLTLSAIPFIARVIETALRETDPGVIEAAKSFGASDWQILWRVYIKESVPRMVGLNGYTLCSGIICAELNGEGCLAVPFRADSVEESSTMELGYITRQRSALSRIGELYIQEMRRTLGLSLGERAISAYKGGCT